jgi:hypothetical protein
MKPLQSLIVSLLHTESAQVASSWINLVIHFSCVLFDDGARGWCTVAEPERGFTKLQAGDGDCRDLVRLAEEAGFAERVPGVQEKVDTSDRFVQVLLVVSHERGSHTLRLSLLCSSYEGPDAPALRQFFARLLKIAGVTDESVIHDLTGEWILPWSNPRGGG